MNKPDSFKFLLEVVQKFDGPDKIDVAAALADCNRIQIGWPMKLIEQEMEAVGIYDNRLKRKTQYQGDISFDRYAEIVKSIAEELAKCWVEKAKVAIEKHKQAVSQTREQVKIDPVKEAQAIHDFERPRNERR